MDNFNESMLVRIQISPLGIWTPTASAPLVLPVPPGWRSLEPRIVRFSSYFGSLNDPVQVPRLATRIGVPVRDMRVSIRIEPEAEAHRLHQLACQLPGNLMLEVPFAQGFPGPGQPETAEAVWVLNRAGNP